MSEGLRQRAVVGAFGAQPIELAYDVFGERGRPLVLVMGIGAQRIFWDDAWCGLLVAAGFQVVRFDHRDTGESTRLDAPVPKPGGVLARRLFGAAVTAPYSLSDMAHDVVGLLDALGWDRAHVVGASLGGMVGQHLAIEHPARVRSLTAIMTTPGARRFLPKPFALRALFAPAPRDAEQAGEHAANLFTTIGSTAWPVDRARLLALGAEAYRRGMNPRGFLRQFAAVAVSGDRARSLATVHVPTLVIHGSRDPMFPLSAGRTLARLVPHATWLPVTGMGHDLPAPMWPTFVAAIARHAGLADARGTL
ncbi:MAG TPA: alpha/beta hydrolase [Kofleriaceae bacterium]|jgi:pimeloyl-ACP methyl ester carboxylesterase